MKKNLIVLSLLSLVFTTIQLKAQVTELTLNQAVDIALKNNFQIKQAENNLKSAEMNEFANKMNIWTPSVNGSLRFGQNSGRQFNQITGEINEEIITSSSGGVNLSYTIFDGLRNIYNLRSAKNQRISQRESLERAKEDIIFNVATQYLTLLLDIQLLEIAKENLKSTEDQLKLIKAQVEVGSVPVADLYNQESIVANNELLVIQRENTISNDKMTLIRSLQLDPLREYDFVVPDIDEVDTSKNYDVNQLVRLALDKRSDLKALKATIESNRYGYKAAIGQHYPTLSFSTGVNTNYNDRFTDLVLDDTGAPVPDGQGGFLREKVPFTDQFFDRNRNLSFNFNMQIPIYNQFAVRNNVQRTKVVYKNSILNFENQKIGVAQEIKRAYLDYVNFYKQYQSSEKAVKSAQKALETQEERYKIGASNLIELSQANAQFVEASSNKAQAQFRLIFQEKLIDYYVGNLDVNLSIN